MTTEKSNSVKLPFTKNKLEITANSPEVGEAKESQALNYKGKILPSPSIRNTSLTRSTRWTTTKCSSS
jgi:hypothetical protein